ncbi:hypothetical protein DOK67_0000682 [Enterococcus sp. DIV0212c]|uniref:hypothetical protein n=1 Tax=Enterococcus sp. DIV0212c TaxID=2230867 RepID=UPI001A9AF0B9|nr:hypothetical protein [Enterococcus sp. DIV0212c]MBO1354667.1 hypothetical protein [Enterococcus sp. DIV0212c]
MSSNKKHYAVIFKNSNVNLFVSESILNKLKKMTYHFFNYFSLDNLAHNQTKSWSISYVDKMMDNSETHQTIAMESDVEEDIKYYFSSRKKEILVFRGKMNDEWLARSIMRLIRNIFRFLAMENGEIFPHGGLVSINEKGVAFIGEKRSGKTTNILNCLKSGADFVSNDDVSIMLENEKLIAYGWPRGIGVRGDSLKMVLGLEDLSSLYETLNHPGNKIIEYSDFKGLEPNGLIFFQPEELSSTFHCKVIPSIQLDMIVFTQFTDDTLMDPVLEELAFEEGVNKLASNILINPGKHNEFLLESFDFCHQDEVYEKYIKYLKNVKMFKLKTGFTKDHKVPRLINEICKGNN